MLHAAVVACCLAAASLAATAAIPLGSAHALVVDEATGEVLLGKDAETPAPIASLTKLMTAMLVLDAGQDLDDVLRIERADRDRLKYSRVGLPVGARATRRTMIELALIASDNHAAAALARNYPGGLDAFRAAATRKAAALELEHTRIDEPTGLSPHNRSSARDVVKILRAAADYPLIAAATARPAHTVEVNGRPVVVRNTNRLVGAPGWTILLSKTGFTNEAGRCVTMRLEAAGRTVAVVLMGAVGAAERQLDARNIERWLRGEPPLAALKAPRRTRAAVERRPRVSVALQRDAAQADGRAGAMRLQ